MSKSKHPKKEVKKAKAVVGVAPIALARKESKVQKVARGAVKRAPKPTGQCGHELVRAKMYPPFRGSPVFRWYCETCFVVTEPV
jgi:hypothetical protein